MKPPAGDAEQVAQLGLLAGQDGGGEALHDGEPPPQAIPQVAHVAEFLAERLTPGAGQVRLVDDDGLKAPLGVERPHLGEVGLEPLRRHADDDRPFLASQALELACVHAAVRSEEDGGDGARGVAVRQQHAEGLDQQDRHLLVSRKKVGGERLSCDRGGTTHAAFQETEAWMRGCVVTRTPARHARSVMRTGSIEAARRRTLPSAHDAEGIFRFKQVLDELFLAGPKVVKLELFAQEGAQRRVVGDRLAGLAGAAAVVLDGAGAAAEGDTGIAAALATVDVDAAVDHDRLVCGTSAKNILRNA